MDWGRQINVEVNGFVFRNLLLREQQQIEDEVAALYNRYTAPSSYEGAVWKRKFQSSCVSWPYTIPCTDENKGNLYDYYEGKVVALMNLARTRINAEKEAALKNFLPGQAFGAPVQ